MIAFATAEYTVTREAADFGTILHCEVHKSWSPAVKQNLIRDVEHYQSITGIREPAYACYFLDEDPKIRKFMVLMGFKTWRFATAGDGRAVLLMQRP